LKKQGRQLTCISLSFFISVISEIIPELLRPQAQLLRHSIARGKEKQI
jgi:hypothetical protein